MAEAAALVAWVTSEDASPTRRKRGRRRGRAIPSIIVPLLLATVTMVVRAAAVAIAWAAARSVNGIRLMGARAFTLHRRTPSAVALPSAARDALEPARLSAPDTATLALSTRQWMERESKNLPSAAQHALTAVAKRVEALAVQLHDVPAESSARAELRRLVAEELPELVRSYRRVPTQLTQLAADEGDSPDGQLLAGIAIIDGELARLHGRLAERDLRALATHLRFLALKYLPAGELTAAHETALHTHGGDARAAQLREAQPVARAR